MPGSDGQRIWGFEKKQLVEIWTWTKRVDFRSSLRRDQLGSTGCLRVGWVSELRGDDGQTVSIVRNCFSLSSCRKPQEGNKRFRTWTNFVFFGFLLCVWTLWTFNYMNIMNVLCMWISWSYFWTWICYKTSITPLKNWPCVRKTPCRKCWINTYYKIYIYFIYLFINSSRVKVDPWS